MDSGLTSSAGTELPHVLREYGFIADGERGALIGPRGDVAWLCLPGWDSGAVFSSLIGGAGAYAVTPAGRFVWGGYYETGSLIWRSRWVTESGIVECREALAFPGDPHHAVLLRQLRVVEGEAVVDIRLQPAAEFGRRHLTHVHRDGSGCWLAELGDLRMRWRADEVTVVGDSPAERALTARLSLSAGESRDLVLEFSDQTLPAVPVDAAGAWAETQAGWRSEIPAFGPMAADRDAAHGYAVMRGMTTAAGGMVAAATMSLPERADEGANYDYRYVWIRDQCIAGLAVAADGPHLLLDKAAGFVTERLLDDGPDLMPAYTTRGTAIPPQSRLDLVGYPGGYDIVGNHVREQFQLDSFGEALLLLSAAGDHDMLDAGRRRAIEVAVDAIGKNWRREDAGIWELNNRWWTHSRLICVAGLRAAASRGLTGRDGGAASALADTIVAELSQSCVHPSGRWQRAPDDNRLDAALMLPGLRGALPVDDARTVATYRAVRDGLGCDHFVYRFPPAAGAAGADCAFLLCGFVMAMVAAQQHEPLTAIRYFERNRSACGPPGLFSEEYDIRQRQMRGNLPQAFVHAVMFEASSRLAAL